MKRVLPLLLTLVLVLSACGGSAGTATEAPAAVNPSSAEVPAEAPAEAPAAVETPSVDASALPAMTTEPITLRYAYWGQHEKGEPEVTAAQKKAFEDKYPNITLEFVEIDQAQWDEALQNFAATGMLPDVFGVFSVSNAVMNEWALPLNEWYDKDPDTVDMYESFANNAQINGVRYSMPWVMFPHLVFVNKTLFEKYNEPLPSYDWTVDEFFEIAERMSHPEEFYFGISNPIFEDLFPAWYNGGQGKWGWDGTEYNFDQVWVDSLNKKWDLVESNVIEWESAEDKEKFLGAADAWPPGWGRTALHIDWPWTIAAFEDNYKTQSGCEWLYYPLPKGPSGEQLAIVDNAVIGASTKYPREAWELLKQTTWGEEANLVRQQAYRDAGANVSRMPVTTNRNVWNDLIENAATENLAETYARLQTGLVPSNWPLSPAWGDIEAWIIEQDVYGKIERREINAADIAPELNEKAKELKNAWIANIPQQ
jgi:multiple sugar transport system substrate-binding protein